MQRVIFIALLLGTAAPLAAQEREPHKTALHWGIGCSVAADIADALSTIYALRTRDDLVEGNPIIGWRANNSAKLWAIKAAGAAVSDGLAIYIHKDNPVPAALILYGNCAVKSYVTVRNLRLAREKPASSLALTVRLSW